MQDIKMGYHNEFDIVVRDAKTGEVKRTEKAYNIMLNGFWANLLRNVGSGSCFGSIAFGSGTATPIATDTTLTTRVGSKGIGNKTLDFSTQLIDGVVKAKGSIRLEASEYVGSTISEVGISNDGTNMLTKSLLKDANGNAIAITKSDTDVIDIYATLYIKFAEGIRLNPLADAYYWSAWLTIAKCLDGCAPSSTTFMNAFYYAREDGTVSGKYSGSVSFDVANKKMMYTLPEVAASEANFGGITQITENNGTWLPFLPNENFIQPTIIKEVLGIGDGTKVGFTPAFGRLKDTANLKVYVDDVEKPATFLTDLSFPYDINQKILKITSEAKYDIFENPLCQLDYGKITTVACARLTLEVSNNLSTWTTIGDYPEYAPPAQVAIPIAYQSYRYWKFTDYLTPRYHIYFKGADFLQVILDVAPAIGETVALSYDTNCIAKDANHVLRNTVFTFSFGEYTPA